MSTTMQPETAYPAADRPVTVDTVRLSTRFGLAFTICQIAVMIVMAIVVLPHGGGPSEPALKRGHSVHEVDDLYRAANYVFILVGMLFLGFLGSVRARLQAVDRTGVLATTALASGSLLALVWPLGGLLHDIALDAADAGTDLRLLGAWDSVAPYSLAFSVMPRLFFVGAVVLGLRATSSAPWLRRTGIVIIVLSAVGSATLVAGAFFPFLALSTLGFELWVGALAWQWLREGRSDA